LASATVTPTAPSVHDTLVCTAGATADADGDDVGLSYAWTVNGTVTAEASSSYTSALTLGDTISCTITPSDDEADGTPVESAIVEVNNAAPSITTVNITPDPAYIGDILTCSYTGFEDADGDADLSTIAWTIDGMLAGTGTTLSGGFVGGNEVVCTVTPGDGITTGEPVSVALTIAETSSGEASYDFVAASEYFDVPEGVTQLTISAAGAMGGDAEDRTGGYGGHIDATIDVVPGEVLQVNVGGPGSTFTGSGVGGWNGGGDGDGSGGGISGSGGGATDIRRAPYELEGRLVVAGGGGGGAGGAAVEGDGGYGGGLVGGDGTSDNPTYSPGEGGTQSEGGLSGSAWLTWGDAGEFGLGGWCHHDGSGCGAGGGGWYGGGGGAFNGGGGGSSYAEPSATDVAHFSGIEDGPGSMYIEW
jgi:hypothetical protein